MSSAAIISKVQKLLALAKKNSNLHEAEAAMAAANKLIDDHRLSESQLEFSSEEESIVKDDASIYECARITSWKSALICGLSKHYGCAIFNQKAFRLNQYKLVGRKSDIEIIKYMFSWLVLEIERLCSAESEARYLDRSRGKIFANSFCSGAVSGILEKLAVSRKEIKNAENSQAMIRLDERYNQAYAFLNKMHNLKKSSSYSKSYIDDAAYMSGKLRGSNIHLGADLNAAIGVKLLNK